MSQQEAESPFIRRVLNIILCTGVNRKTLRAGEECNLELLMGMGFLKKNQPLLSLQYIFTIYNIYIYDFYGF